MKPLFRTLFVLSLVGAVLTCTVGVKYFTTDIRDEYYYDKLYMLLELDIVTLIAAVAGLCVPTRTRKQVMETE